jgi:hypothetical protein
VAAPQPVEERDEDGNVLADDHVSSCNPVNHDLPCVTFDTLEEKCTGIAVPAHAASYCDLAYAGGCKMMTKDERARILRAVKCDQHATTCDQYRSCEAIR